MTIILFEDGSLSYFNGRYPWCQTLEPEDVERTRESLTGLSAETIETPNVASDSLVQGATVVHVAYNYTGASPPEDPFRKTISWSSATESSPEAVQALDQLFCSLEVSLGSGYRRQMKTHFGDFLSARERSRPCSE